MLGFTNSLLRIATILFFAGCLVVAPIGCTFWQRQDETASDPAYGFGSKMRKPTEPGQASGFDSRAKEIEKNLGVR